VGRTSTAMASATPLAAAHATGAVARRARQPSQSAASDQVVARVSLSVWIEVKRKTGNTARTAAPAAASARHRPNSRPTR
jgi:hypothetical protein